MRLTRAMRAGVLLALAGAVACAHAPQGAEPEENSTRPATAAPPAAAPNPPLPPAMFWNAATIYFAMTDRFENGDTTNDHALGRAHDGAVLRSFEGGDFAGLLRKVNEGYFDSLGVTAIWLTPFVEQIHGSVDEGTGKTYGYHGYWARDWTAIDPAFGTAEQLHSLVDAAHRHGIRMIMDAVINHTGPPTDQDPAWPADWVRTGPNCTYRSFATTTACTLVATLPDVLTESDDSVGLPPALADKWRAEGRLEREQASLDDFFHRTHYPRAPRYYIIKWLTDWVRAYGFDGYRIDTAKHFGEAVSAALRHEAELAFADWKHNHRTQVLDSLPFYMVGEVYGWGIAQGRNYDYGDRTVDFFAHGYDALINFAFKSDAARSLDTIYTAYSQYLADGPLRGTAILNYLSSHDDGQPFDLGRTHPREDANRLLLAPGGAQITWGDETDRPLQVPGAVGDANLRSMMNWGDLSAGGRTADVLAHWRRLGQFRHEHPAVGAGVHQTISLQPFIFSRTLDTGAVHDHVIVAEGVAPGYKTIPVGAAFPTGTPVIDYYSGEGTTVVNGHATLTTPYDMVLLGERSLGGLHSNAPVRVNVTNNYSGVMDVIAVAAGTQYRLGEVSPGTREAFQLRPAMLMSGGRVDFWVQPGLGAVTGGRVNAGSLLLHPGAVVDITITTQLIGTTATVRP